MAKRRTTEIILPKSTRQNLEDFPLTSRHPGLQLDKFGKIPEGESSGAMELQKRAIREVTNVEGDRRMLKALNDRRTAMLRGLGARVTSMTAAGPLTLHLSRPGTWENAGICFHPVYGFVYLPGSGIKGIVRSFAETVWASAQEDKEQAWDKIDEIFGFSPRSEAHKFRSEERPGWRPASIRPKDGGAAGRIVFHDAWPETWPPLEVDIANNHHTGYYGEKNEPGDWESPIPVSFLAVPAGVRFSFAISDRSPREDAALGLVVTWLHAALQVEGAGAKTAAGYGRFVGDGKASAVLKDYCSQEYALKLASPAFLAGASQKEADCNLRGATLRGLLRWWWRTMYAEKVDIITLRKLEAAVWGDTKQGSPVRVAVRQAGAHTAKSFSQSPQFKHEHGIGSSGSRRGRTTLGLYYASYGMAEKRRWYREAGSAWQVTVTARSGRLCQPDKNYIPLSAETLLAQAAASLWLLARYGGAGSKSRKGFGSFLSIEVPGISSRSDCHERARSFLAQCEISHSSDRLYAPALGAELSVPEVKTAWVDAWYACHQVGGAMQKAIRSLDKGDRAAIGLPRRGARRAFKRKGDRHASPVLWSLDRRPDDKLSVRLIAFPSPWLPNFEDSRRILQDFLRTAERELNRWKDTYPRNLAREVREPDAAGQVARPAAIPKQGTRVKVVLLEEKTKKGGWKALHEPSGFRGVVQDSITGEVAPGQEVELHVQYVNRDRKEIAFRWKAQSKTKRPTKSSHSSPQGGRERSRRRRR